MFRVFGGRPRKATTSSSAACVRVLADLAQDWASAVSRAPWKIAVRLDFIASATGTPSAAAGKRTTPSSSPPEQDDLSALRKGRDHY
jgi:hypothetical protein